MITYSIFHLRAIVWHSFNQITNRYTIGMTLSVDNQSTNQSVIDNQSVINNQSIALSSSLTSTGTVIRTNVPSDGDNVQFCGIPGIDLTSINQSLNFTRSSTLWYFNPCGQVSPANPFSALACLRARDGDVLACELPPNDRNGFTLATAGVNNTNIRYVEMFSPRGISMTLPNTGGDCSQSYNQATRSAVQSINQTVSSMSSSSALPKWSLDARIFCRGEFDEPTLYSFAYAGVCSQSAVIYSRAACRCGLPGFDLYPIEAQYGSITWNGLDGPVHFSPCGVLTHYCNDTYVSRSSICQTSPTGSTNLLKFTPDDARWNATIINGVDVVTMTMVGSNDISPWTPTTATVNYWCNTSAVEPFISNVSILIAASILVTIDVQLQLACTNSISSSSTGSPDVPHSDDSINTSAIVVITVGIFLLLCVVLLCWRARRNVERFSYMENDVRYQHYNPQLNNQNAIVQREPREVEIFEPQYRIIAVWILINWSIMINLIQYLTTCLLVSCVRILVLTEGLLQRHLSAVVAVTIFKALNSQQWVK